MEASEEKRSAYLKHIKDISPKSLVYIDESGVDQTCTKPRGWGKVGQVLVGKQTGHYTRRTNIVAGLCEKNLVAPMLFQGSCCTILFVKWVENFLVKALKPGQVVVMDNASFHKSPKIKAAIEAAGCRLIFLPPYSPDLNPIETFWANMKAWIKNNIGIVKDFWNALQLYFDNTQT